MTCDEMFGEAEQMEKTITKKYFVGMKTGWASK